MKKRTMVKVTRTAAAAALLLAAAVGLPGCAKDEAGYCDAEEPCTNPARPVCDLTGADGEPNQCVPAPDGGAGSTADAGSEPDARPPDPPDAAP